MSGATAGARMGKTKEEGQELLENFFKGFPKVEKTIADSKAFLRRNGYVEDFIGRRRRLDDINLLPYEAKLKNISGTDPNFNPIIGCSNRTSKTAADTWNQILAEYVILSNAHQLAKIDDAAVRIGAVIDNSMSNQTFDKFKKIALNAEYEANQPWFIKKDDSKTKSAKKPQTCAEKLKADAGIFYDLISYGTYKKGYGVNTSGVCLADNANFKALIDDYVNKYGYSVIKEFPIEKVDLFAWTGRIAQAERQCFNARIQGSAATLTKIAMVDINNDTVMQDCQAGLIIPVHDELLVECPEFYADLVEKRLPEIMIAAAAKHITDVGMKCDPYNVTRWYADEYTTLIQEEFKKAEKSGLSGEEAFKKVCDLHKELDPQVIDDVLTGKAEMLNF